MKSPPGELSTLSPSCADDLEVPTPKSYGIDHDTWTELTPLMAQQAIASGSPANNPVLPSHDDIERIYADVYG